MTMTIRHFKRLY